MLTIVCFTLWLIATTAFLRTASAFGDTNDDDFFVPICEGYYCGSGRVCLQQALGPTCAVKNGLPCTSGDFCEGGYYCPSAKVCNGESDGIPEGSPCPKGIGCKQGLYCDLKQEICLKIDGGDFCIGDFQCSKNCPSPKGCYCYDRKCIPNPNS